MLKIPVMWRPRGFTREAIESCRDAVCAYNIQTLPVVGLVTVLLLGADSVAALLIEKAQASFWLHLAACVLIAGVCIAALYAHSRKKHKPLVFYALFSAYYIILMFLGFYLGVLTPPDQWLVLTLLFLLFSQALFVVDLRFSVLLNLLTASAFSLLALKTKAPLIREIDTIHVWMAAILALALNRYLGYVILREMIASRRLEIERDHFREESIKDELTGLSNRREYQSAAKFYISVCRHVHQTICAIMLDVDFFKNYNDFYGHQKGDEALQAIGGVLKRLVTEEQLFAARVGGEEFFVLWTENRTAEAERVAIKIRHLIADLKIPHERSTVAPHITVSLGLYMLRGGADATVDDLYREADDALYEAKERGRNCIMLRDSADRSLRMVDILPPEQNVGRR
ncbi:MAG: GGDEF domain-containing protein [Spirochaetaceae bacterium]|jgi:diguanylate cyclase (GGDEF)-like protein|nr:GGDEF domain-containing protein [Spirochaetaceae bacterium]